MKVMKFGGTSVGTISSLTNVKNIVDSLEDPAIVVVSALGGLTDKLIATAKEAVKSSDGIVDAMRQISRRHEDIIRALVPDNLRNDVWEKVDCLQKELYNVFVGISLIRSLPERVLDIVVSFGERISSVIVASILKDAEHYDSLEFMRTERWFNKDVADSSLTGELIQKEFTLPLRRHVVMGGFISRDRDTLEITNLGRGGSDYSAAIMASVLNAEILEIWTDVDGFMTSDPRLIKNASIIPSMTFIESMQLCTFGAKVIYPPTIYPVFHKNIPIKILNTFNPEAPGTYISDLYKGGGRVIGVSMMKGTSLIRVIGNAKASLSEIHTRAYNALTKNGIGILLANSSENLLSVEIAIKEEERKKTEELLRSEFAPEIQNREINGIHARGELTIIAAVGESIKKLNGLGARLTQTLLDNNIEIVALSDGISETTVAVIVATYDSENALRLIHDNTISQLDGCEDSVTAVHA